jgi:two-component system sensor histidine kinase VanS
LAGGIALLAAFAVLRYVPELPSRVEALRDSGAGVGSRREVVVQVGRVAVSTLIVLAAIGAVGLRRGASARLRLALSYGAFLTVAGGIALLGVYVVLRYVPEYPLAVPGQLGTSVATRSEILEAVVGVSGSVLAALAVIGVSGGWVLAGWILRPLQRISDAAKAAAAGDLGHRIHLTGRSDEFRQLADTFDHMLDRLDGAFASQERFAANASHELRTPLTVTATLLDVARHNPAGQDYPTLIDRLTITNARAIGLTEALLRLADANAITAISEPVDLATVVREVLADNTAEADALGVALDVHLGSAPTTGDPDLLAQLASNLIQNAIRHNLTTSGIVWITTRHDAAHGRVSLRVENTGAVYTDEIAAQLTEPFLRGSGRIRQSDRTAKGYGLGLALVARIAEVHRGALTITPRDGGGLIVTFSMPAAPHLE